MNSIVKSDDFKNLIRIDEKEVAACYAEMDRIGCLGENRSAGYLRAAYSDEETAAMRYIEKLAQQIGGKSRWDRLGNLAIEWPGKTNEYVEVASHLDTVPMGGNFDGAAGVIVGLLAIRRIVESGVERTRGLRLRVWRGEESATFGVVYIGSMAAFGKLPAKSLAQRFRGKSLEEAMRGQGADPDLIKNGTPTILQPEIDSIAAHFELHIEQGNLLEKKELDIGVVTSIRGAKKIRVVLTGSFDHSGATPMGVEYRSDVNLALGQIIVGLDDLIGREQKAGRDIIQTVGVINADREINEREPLVYNNAMTKVSGYGYFSLDLRSNSNAVLEQYTKQACELISKISDNLKVKAEIKELSFSAPLESVTKELSTLLFETAGKLGYSKVYMPSGAGHDTLVVGGQRQSKGQGTPVAMLFIPCLEGKSHCPEEFATFEAIAKGASVLASSMLALC